MKKYWWIAIFVFVADFVTKRLASNLSAPMAVIPGVIGLRYAENTGMAFSMFGGYPWLLGIISALAILFGFLILRRYYLKGFAAVASMLMLGGAVGNMIDRFFTGYVVDMIEVLAFRFAIFNLADAALCIGAAMMAVSILFRADEWGEKNEST